MKMVVKVVNESGKNGTCFFIKKMGHPRPLFPYFRLSNTPVPVVMVEVVVIVIWILAGFVVMLKLVVIAVVAGLWK